MAIRNYIRNRPGDQVRHKLPWIDFYGVRIPDPSRKTKDGNVFEHSTVIGDPVKLGRSYDGIARLAESVSGHLVDRIESDESGQLFSSRDNRLSLLQDVGLPRVGTFAAAAKEFASSLKNSTSLGFVPVQDTAVYSLLPQTSISMAVLPQYHQFMFGLIRRFLHSFADPRTDSNRRAYMELTRSLSGLHWQDSSGVGAQTPAWLDTFGQALVGYMTAFFSGAFRDRNGTTIRFDEDLAGTDFFTADQLHVSPQTAGQIVSVLVEFLGDALLPVPYYGAEILATYRAYRAADPAQRSTPEFPYRPIEQINLIRETILRAGQISDSQAARLGITLVDPQGKLAESVDLAWEHIVGTLGGETPVVDLTVARALLTLLQEFDAQQLVRLKARTRLTGVLDQIREHLEKPEDEPASELQTRFTCFKHGVIRGHLHCVFINRAIPMKDNLIDLAYFEKAEYSKTAEECREDPDGACECMRDQIGSHSGHVDYSDLVGKIIRFVGQATARNTRAVAGGLIRGLSIASLDNEVVAEIVSSSLAAVWKKAAEWATFQILVRWITDNRYGEETDKKDILSLLESVYEVLEGDDT